MRWMQKEKFIANLGKKGIFFVLKKKCSSESHFLQNILENGNVALKF